MRFIAAILVSAFVLASSMAFLPTDATEAANPLMSVSLFDSQGSKVDGNLLDSKSIDIATYTDWNTKEVTYTIESLTPLISDTRYLIISPEEAGDCTLTVTAELQSGFIIEAGLTLTFFRDITHSEKVGELTYGNGNPDEQMLNSLLTAGQKYYITAVTAQDYVRTDMSPSSFYQVDFTFTATTAEGTNALYYHANDGVRIEPVLSKLVTNGQVYGAQPDITLPGHVLAGWFTQPEGGVAIHPNDTVQLIEEQHLYAHWLTEGEEEIHIDENENEEWIWITVSEDQQHVKIEGRSYTSRVFTEYDADVVDGMVIVDTHNTAADFTMLDARDANEQYSVVKQVLTERGFDVRNYIVIGAQDKIVCEEGSLGKLLETDCNDFRVVGDALTISMDRSVINDLKSLPGETVIETYVATPDKLTEAQRKVIGDRPAYEIRVTNNGVEIESFSGTITAWFGYEAPKNMSSMQVYSAWPDGSTEVMQYTYREDTVTFQTGHLSVFYLDVQTDDEKSTIWWPYMLILIAALTLWFIFMAKKKRKDEDESKSI